ncbi:TetR family transcriptional regulator [Clostridium sardiniense]|uniref:TetR family transcriptional regulator n=1 Tax=Clostridium sardiniense TaxID=29369 RepID=UPI00195796CE|nr:AcrR family transcriptional regulator [Clostridium sardiniense]
MARNKHPEVTVNRILDASLKLFLEKGYEQTTIQDIINELGDLSKGAIYHHFKSKEDIIDAVSERLFEGTNREILRIKSKKDLTGLEKIRRIYYLSIQNPNQEKLITAAPTLLKNPKFLAEQVITSIEDVAPLLKDLIEEGIEDGSIKADHPKELSEMLILLSNIWLNPMIFSNTSEELKQKFLFLKELTDNLGLPIFDEDMLNIIDKYRELVSIS